MKRAVSHQLIQNEIIFRPCRKARRLTSPTRPPTRFPPRFRRPPSFSRVGLSPLALRRLRADEIDAVPSWPPVSIALAKEEANSALRLRHSRGITLHERRRRRRRERGRANRGEPARRAATGRVNGPGLGRRAGEGEKRKADCEEQLRGPGFRAAACISACMCALQRRLAAPLFLRLRAALFISWQPPDALFGRGSIGSVPLEFTSGGLLVFNFARFERTAGECV